MDEQLIADLERATEGSRELDSRIELSRRRFLFGAAAVAGMVAQPTGWIVGGGEQPIKAPAFSTSLDAALTLVPEGWMWDVSSSGCAWIMRNDDSICDSQIVIGGVESPALALCIAALKVREGAK